MLRAPISIAPLFFDGEKVVELGDAQRAPHASGRGAVASRPGHRPATPCRFGRSIAPQTDRMALMKIVQR